MRVLLTGASGFVGGHILDELRDRKFDVTVLLRPTSNRRWTAPHEDHITLHAGSIADPDSLVPVLRDVTHVVHCAGLTRSYRAADFFRVNQQGTRHLLDALREAGSSVEHFLHVSSLAAFGPATPDQPARESDEPRPVSVYGQSKLAAETEVRQRCSTPYTILRPSGVYGPRDGDFLHLFKAVSRGFLPCFGGGRQALSLVYVKDLARVVVDALQRRGTGKIFHVAAPEVVTAGVLGEIIAQTLERRPYRLCLPVFCLWPVCLGQECLSRLTGKPHILSRLKYPELKAPGWVCSVDRLSTELDIVCGTTHKEGIEQTLSWYRHHGWM